MEWWRWAWKPISLSPSDLLQLKSNAFNSKSRSFKMYVNREHLILIAYLMTSSFALKWTTPIKRDCSCQFLVYSINLIYIITHCCHFADNSVMSLCRQYFNQDAAKIQQWFSRKFHIRQFLELKLAFWKLKPCRKSLVSKIVLTFPAKSYVCRHGCA